MTLRLAAAAAVVLISIAGCDRSAQPATAETAPDAKTQAAQTAPAPAAERPAADGPEPSGPSTDSAPAFAVVYPGARVEGQPLTGDGDAGAGGLITFVTTASPDDVVAFYRQRAETAGLRTVTGMNQGEARAYGAAGDTADGPSLQVVAAPTDAGDTSVQLSWSAGQ